MAVNMTVRPDPLILHGWLAFLAIINDDWRWALAGLLLAVYSVFILPIFSD
jgi:hypothetical protein